MIYGLYLSATGVVTNSHTTDVIANNLANVETVGFRRQLVTYTERPPEAIKDPTPRHFGDPRLNRLGGGQLLAPSRFDQSPGTFEASSSPLHLAITGDGYFAVRAADGQNYLTRNGQFMLNAQGELLLSTEGQPRVLDSVGEPIRIENVSSEALRVTSDGTVSVGDTALVQIGLHTIAEPEQLRPVGGTLLKLPDDIQPITAREARIEAGFVERSNVDPAVELTRLIESQRQLEANANLIRYQDQTLGRLVNDVGRIR